MNDLLEFYGILLTEKQQEYLRLYYAEDFSLGEIADEFDVSRQAVYDNIRRTETLLKEYEEKLHLIKQFNYKQDQLTELKNYIQSEYAQDVYLQQLARDLGREAAKGEKDGI